MNYKENVVEFGNVGADLLPNFAAEVSLAEEKGRADLSVLSPTFGSN